MAYKIQQFPVMFMWTRFKESQFGKPNMGVSWGRDYDESIDDGISIYQNPFASNPVPEGFVKKFQTIHRDVFEIESADNSLLTRLTHQFSFYDDGKTVQDDLEELNEMISKARSIISEMRGIGRELSRSFGENDVADMVEFMEANWMLI